jgi:SAM-dependent methyltransferase
MSEEVAAPIKLNIGSGPTAMEGFLSIDTIKFNDDIVQFNAGTDVWPYEDNSVDEVHCSHTLEHMTNFGDKWERVHFFNELYRVLKDKGKATIIIPHWNSCRYYGDPTHKEPISEFAFYYLSKEWRAVNAPHANGKGVYSEDLNFEATWGYGMNPAIVTRNPEYQQYAMANFKEAINDLYCTLIKKVPVVPA